MNLTSGDNRPAAVGWTHQQIQQFHLDYLIQPVSVTSRSCEFIIVIMIQRVFLER